MTVPTHKVIAGSPDKPIRIGDIEIPCYVVENEIRVLVQRGVLDALTMARGTGGGAGDRLSDFLAGKRISPFVSNDLRLVIENPLIFDQPHGGGIAYGYPATVLPDICDVILKARQNGALEARQLRIASVAEILVRGMSRVGIIGLVDEATGYQDIRSRHALADILEKWLSKELQTWTRTFPEEFYKEIFRLRNWSYRELGEGTRPARPGIVGSYTIDLVYQRLPLGLWQELKSREPQLPNGRRRNRFHQWFTPDFGHPRLKDHLTGVMALMRANDDWPRFMRSVNRSYPKQEQQWELPLPDEDNDESKAA